MKAKPPSQDRNSGIADAKQPVEDLDAEFRDFECSQLFQQALDGDRTSALVMWRQVAEGRRDQETRLWTILIAERILEADGIADSKRRPDTMMAAVSLSGRQDLYRPHRQALRELVGFTNLVTGKKARMTLAEKIKLLRDLNLVKGHVNDDAVCELIEKLSKSSPKSPDKSV